MKTEIRYESEKRGAGCNALIKGDILDITTGIAVIVDKIMESCDYDHVVKKMIKECIDLALEYKEEK